MGSKLAKARSAIVFVGALLLGVEASARGFCNADGTGDEKQFAIVADAAAQFYQGGQRLMAMLDFFERSDQGGLQEAASGASGAFRLSAETFRAAAGEYEGLVGFETGDVESVMLLARTSDAELVLSILELGSSTPVLNVCADLAQEMSEEIDRFVAGLSVPRTPVFSDLLNRFSDTLRFGTAVSAAFANAGGESAN